MTILENNIGLINFKKSPGEATAFSHTQDLDFSCFYPCDKKEQLHVGHMLVARLSVAS